MAAFAPRRQLQLLTVRRNEELVALLPAVTRMRRVVAPVNAETPVMGPLAVDDRAAGALLPGLLARTHHADLRFLPEGDTRGPLLPRRRPGGCAGGARSSGGPPTRGWTATGTPSAARCCRRDGAKGCAGRRRSSLAWGTLTSRCMTAPWTVSSS